MSRLAETMDEIINIWGRELNIKIIFECYGEGTITKVQSDTYDDFKKNKEEYLKKTYQAIVEYLKTNYAEMIGDGNINNIFKYVVPREIFIKQYTKDKKSFGIICHFKFDRENGIAVRFANGEVKMVGPEQIM